MILCIGAYIISHGKKFKWAMPKVSHTLVDMASEEKAAIREWAQTNLVRNENGSKKGK
jgi:hypothetical protein